MNRDIVTKIIDGYTAAREDTRGIKRLIWRFYVRDGEPIQDKVEYATRAVGILARQPMFIPNSTKIKDNVSHFNKKEQKTLSCVELWYEPSVQINYN